MIEDLRFVERFVPAPELGENMGRTVKILQASDGYVWFDVPLVKGGDDE